MQQLLIGHQVVTMSDQAEMIFFYIVDLDHHACLFLKPATEISEEDGLMLSSAAGLQFNTPQTAILLQPYLQTPLCLVDKPQKPLSKGQHFFEGFLQRFLNNRYFACSSEGLRQILNGARHLYNQQYDCQ